MFVAIGIVLPFFTGQIQLIGNMLLPMHIPVMLCGLIPAIMTTLEKIGVLKEAGRKEG